MIQAIVFDCYGVLLEDSLKKLMDEVRERDPEHGRELTDILHANHRGMVSSQEAFSKLSVGLGFSEEDLKEWLTQGERKNVPLLSYILELRKKYKTAMLSNVGKGSLAKRFTTQELSDHFDAVVLSGEIGYAKPEAEAYEIVAERLGVRLDSCVFTDDRLEFCEGARGVGMQAIHFTNFSQFKSDLERLLSNAE